MTIKYKFYKGLDGTNTGVIKTGGSETLHIPLSNGNRHYEEYLKWVAEGNTAEAAD